MTILYGHVEVLSPELWQAFKLSLCRAQGLELQGDIQSRSAAGK